MKDLLDIGDLSAASMPQLDLFMTLFNFSVCILMAFIVRAFYMRRSFSLSGKTHIGSILPILSAVIFLVIVVVKSSLALSLGLVGALSIVRFRTPIKEPEELVYLFLAIAIGLGYGAGYVLVTTTLVALILLVIYVWLSNRNVVHTNEYNLIINWLDSTVSLEGLLGNVSEVFESIKLVRLDKGPSGSTAVLLTSPRQSMNYDLIMEKLQSLDPNISVSFYEAKTNW